MRAVDIIKAARAILENPETFTNDDAWGFSVTGGVYCPGEGPFSRIGALGALATAAYDADDMTAGQIAHTYFQNCARDAGYPSFEALTERLGHADTLRAFDAAIQDFQ
jgi:hypothetical protein